MGRAIPRDPEHLEHNMNIEALRAMLRQGVQLERPRVYVSMCNTGRDVNGNRIAHYSAKVYRVGAGWIELCASGRRRPQVGYQGSGRHDAAEVALARLGYALEFVPRPGPEGEAVYDITNL